MLNDFTAILEMSFLVLFMGCTIAISLALLLIQMELVHVNSSITFPFQLLMDIFSHVNLIFGFQQTNSQINSVMLFESVFYGFWAIILVFTTCECGQQFCDAFGNLNYSLGQLGWYFLPIEIQRLLPMIIINSQQPMLVKCYGNISCERDTFKKVNRTHNAYSVQWYLDINGYRIIFLGGRYSIQIFHVSTKILQMKRTSNWRKTLKQLHQWQIILKNWFYFRISPKRLFSK